MYESRDDVELLADKGAGGRAAQPGCLERSEASMPSVESCEACGSRTSSLYALLI